MRPNTTWQYRKIHTHRINSKYLFRKKNKKNLKSVFTAEMNMAPSFSQTNVKMTREKSLFFAFCVSRDVGTSCDLLWYFVPAAIPMSRFLTRQMHPGPWFVLFNPPLCHFPFTKCAFYSIASIDSKFWHFRRYSASLKNCVSHWNLLNWITQFECSRFWQKAQANESKQ